MIRRAKGRRRRRWRRRRWWWVGACANLTALVSGMGDFDIDFDDQVVGFDKPVITADLLRAMNGGGGGGASGLDDDVNLTDLGVSPSVVVCSQEELARLPTTVLSAQDLANLSRDG